jgi:hypothetical protein
MRCAVARQLAGLVALLAWRQLDGMEAALYPSTACSAASKGGRVTVWEGTTQTFCPKVSFLPGWPSRHAARGVLLAVAGTGRVQCAPG